MVLTAPQSLSLFHGAIRPRGVYLSGPAKVFAVWTVYGPGGVRFVAKRHDGAAGSEFMLPVAPDVVRDFDVAALTGDRAAVVYGDGTVLKYFVYDFVADTLISDTAILAGGSDPAMTNDGSLRTTFIDDNVIKMITDLVGDPLDLVESPAYVLQEHNLGTKQAYVIYYLAGHSGSVDIALPIRDDVDSVLVHDCRDASIPGPGLDPPPTTGLAAYFSLDDDAANTAVTEGAGNGVADGVLTGGKNTEDVSVGGVVNTAFDIASPDYVSVPHHALLAPASISMVAWVDRIDAFVNYQTLLCKSYRTGSWADPFMNYALRTDNAGNHKATVIVTVGGTDYSLLGNTTLVTGKRYLLIGTYDGSVMKVYVDGVLDGESSAASGPIDYGGDNTPLLIGRSGQGEWFNGVIDEVRIYDRALDQDEINTIAATGGLWSPPAFSYSDKSGGGNTLDIHGRALDTDQGLRFERVPDVRITDWPVPAFFLTLEALFVPGGQEARGRVLDGDLFMGHDAWGRAYWGYVDGGTTHLYRQTRLTGVVTRRLNHVAVTHQWGVAASTELFVNGLLVPGAWVQGTGATDPALGVITSTVALGLDDLLVQLSVSDVAKSNADIADYAKGRL